MYQYFKNNISSYTKVLDETNDEFDERTISKTECPKMLQFNNSSVSCLTLFKTKPQNKLTIFHNL